MVISSSARAAVWSARQSGYSVRAIDQFGDRDLRELAHSVDVVDDWPDGILAVLAGQPPCPWIYGGGLENWPELIARISARHPLLGCSVEALRQVRDPWRLATVWRAAGLNVPELLGENEVPSTERDWIRKPLRSAGGIGVQTGRASDADHLLQEFIGGDVTSGLYLSDGREVRMLGLARQLAGCPETGAGGFMYCGSIWHGGGHPEAVAAGRAAVEASGLAGLFGIDFIRDAAGRLWPLEINPRFPASAELCERNTDWPLMRWHVDACGSGKLPPESCIELERCPTRPVFGKVVVYAPENLPAPDVRQLARRVLPRDAFVADLPVVGTLLRRGSPCCSIILCRERVDECRQELLSLAAAFRSALAGC